MTDPLHGNLDPIVTILACLVLAIGLVAWTSRRS
ncbi:hypothetical protein Aaci_2365 [Alicyclobacillus acidocaldarius subsp. acidocaldarius DSM 446]|uniref:Uncharacterized protein n=1 Tax=Alicyclobacillus acidocaldarius subsp. acidocaldarius (strain ATCC 27009 / DSM 446 / BCRC 14685 / JCM 5260 / KCTC 1825 / NBRC 15652 / NCIMB 11725 / NRRL B-14509 / 104-IA) TaxID=521098 RepID=C8WRW1_ALIAD|nr:hypothetical protein Aaci_2365 [Alicyclobacillus acidocaldarius subsp. acidocaldarius DSM 446]